MINFLLILLGIALVVVFVQRNKNPEMAKIIMVVLVVLLFLLQGFKWFGGRREIGEPIPLDFERAATHQLGRYIAEAHEGRGSVVILQNNPGTRFSRSQLDGLRQGLRGSDLRAVAERAVLTDPDELMDLEGMWLSPSMLHHAVGEHPNAVAFVSAVGMPIEQDGSFPQEMPPIYVIETPAYELLYQMMQRGVVGGAVIHQPDIDWGATPDEDMSLDEVFEMRYILVTPDNVEQVL